MLPMGWCSLCSPFQVDLSFTIWFIFPWSPTRPRATLSDIDDVDDVDWENTRENHLQMGWLVMDFPANNLYQNHIYNVMFSNNSIWIWFALRWCVFWKVLMFSNICCLGGSGPVPDSQHLVLRVIAPRWTWEECVWILGVWLWVKMLTPLMLLATYFRKRIGQHMVWNSGFVMFGKFLRMPFPLLGSVRQFTLWRRHVIIVYHCLSHSVITLYLNHSKSF